MVSVSNIIQDIIRREGGYVNHPSDKGGPTKYGITQATLSDYLGREVSELDVRDLKVELAEDIYEEKYYRKPKIDRLPEEVQPFLLDACVHHGPDDPILFVQRVCNGAGIAELAVDGVAGPATRAAAHEAQKLMGEVFLKALVEERRNYFLQIVAQDETQKVFLRGWLKRIKEFE